MKKLLAVILLVLSVLSLAACNTQAPVEEPEAEGFVDSINLANPAPKAHAYDSFVQEFGGVVNGVQRTRYDKDIVQVKRLDQQVSDPVVYNFNSPVGAYKLGEPVVGTLNVYDELISVRHA